jgi:hypothetical protein
MEVEPMTADERRLLELLAAADDGATDPLLRAHGFTLEVIINVVSTGLATAKAERTFAAAGRAIEITRVWITDAGRRALAGKAMTYKAPAFAGGRVPDDHARFRRPAALPPVPDGPTSRWR